MTYRLAIKSLEMEVDDLITRLQHLMLTREFRSAEFKEGLDRLESLDAAIITLIDLDKPEPLDIRISNLYEYLGFNVQINGVTGILESTSSDYTGRVWANLSGHGSVTIDSSSKYVKVFGKWKYYKLSELNAYLGSYVSTNLISGILTSVHSEEPVIFLDCIEYPLAPYEIEEGVAVWTRS